MSTHPGQELVANRLQTVAKIIRAGIADQGMDISKAARDWPPSRSTLTRMVGGEKPPQKVAPKFYAQVAIELGLPPRLFRLVLEGDLDAIKELDLDPYVRRIVLSDLDTHGDAAATGS